MNENKNFLREMLEKEEIVAEVNSTQRLSKAALMEKCQTLNIDIKGLRNKHDFAVRIVAANHGWKEDKKNNSRVPSSSSSFSSHKRSKKNYHPPSLSRLSERTIRLECLPLTVKEFVRTHPEWSFRIDIERDAWNESFGYLFSFRSRQVIGKWDGTNIQVLNWEDIDTCKENKLPYVVSEIVDIPTHISTEKEYRERIADYLRGGVASTVEEEEQDEEEEGGGDE
jgi:hypothetical protein